MDTFNNIIRRYEDIALSDTQVLKLVNKKANLILYPDLHKYKNIDQILDPYGACIILYESEPNYGHWCCIFKIDNNILEFFNSYGDYPDVNLEKIPEHFRKESNQNFPHLGWLMYNSPYELTFNEHQFQKYGSGIKSCGRWTAFRIICRHMLLEDFYKMVKYFIKKFKITSDQFVTLVTMWVNR